MAEYGFCIPIVFTGEGGNEEAIFAKEQQSVYPKFYELLGVEE